MDEFKPDIQYIHYLESVDAVSELQKLLILKCILFYAKHVQ